MAGSFKFRFAPTDKIETLLNRNAQWAKNLNKQNPGLFESNAKGQYPSILWIGCADSRVSEQAFDLLPGEVFVHRNVANLVPNCDPSSQSIIQLALETVGCKHIFVCGHTGCKGVQTVLEGKRVGGSLEAWLRNLRDVRAKYSKLLNELPTPEEKEAKLVELNVIEQVYNVRTNDIVQQHVKTNGVEVHGIVYDVATGLLKLLDIPEDPDYGSYAVE